MTDSERKLWSRLRGKQMEGLQFYRQKPLGGHIVDFYAPQVSLVVEVDGEQHAEKTHNDEDCKRDEWLRCQGLEVLRFSNVEVFQETEGVLEKILERVKERKKL